MKGLLVAGLALQGIALALGGRGPLALVVAAVALGAAALSRRTWPFAALALGAAAWHGVSGSTPSAWAAWIAFGLEALVQVLLLVFLLTFRLKRLW